MSLATGCCRLAGITRNNIQIINGYTCRNYASYNDIKWTRPKKVAEWDPEKSGDLGLPVKIEPCQYTLNFESEELKTAPLIVQKLFQVEFTNGKERKRLFNEKAMALVRRHTYDNDSEEVKIAKMTSTIQNLQIHVKNVPKDKRSKICLKELVDKRKKHLRLLRQADYERFEFLLQKLNLIYKPYPEIPGMVSRKDSIRKLATDYCDDLINQKLETYKTELKSKQMEFYTEKLKKLEFIEDQEKKLGLQPSITKEDIEAVKKKIEELQLSN